MFYHFLVIFISIHKCQCLIIHKERSRENVEICLKNHFQSFSTNSLRICYRHHLQDQSITISFTINQNLYEIFHFYRFILRSIDDRSLSTINIYLLTNFTELNDYNNTLKVFNLDLGQYEICIDFRMNSSSYIYSPRYSCIPIQIGDFLHGSFKQSSMELLIALATGIIIFLIICHIIQSKMSEQRSQNANNLSPNSLKKQRDHFIRKIFRRHLDQSRNSQMQQWARIRAFRHRISSVQEQNQRYMKSCHEQIQTSSNDIYIISRKNDNV